MPLFDPKITAGLDIALGLIDAAKTIFDMLKGKEKLTDQELQAIIAKQDAAQKTAREKLLKLIEKS